MQAAHRENAIKIFEQKQVRENIGGNGESFCAAGAHQVDHNPCQ